MAKKTEKKSDPEDLLPRVFSADEVVGIMTRWHKANAQVVGMNILRSREEGTVSALLMKRFRRHVDFWKLFRGLRKVIKLHDFYLEDFDFDTNTVWLSTEDDHLFAVAITELGYRVDDDFNQVGISSFEALENFFNLITKKGGKKR